jgi:hypothetical protein
MYSFITGIIIALQATYLSFLLISSICLISSSVIRYSGGGLYDSACPGSGTFGAGRWNLRRMDKI